MKNLLFILLSPTLLFAVSVGDRLYVKSPTHSYYQQTGTVIKIETGGNTTQAKMDFDGDGVKDGQLIVEFQHTYTVVTDDSDPDDNTTNYDRNETKTIYYGFTEDFASSGWGNVGEYRFVAKLSITAHWRYFDTSGGSWTITVNDYDIVAHNIPTGHFKVGIDTWRLSEINTYEPLMGTNSQLGNNVYLSSISENILPKIFQPTPGLTASRDITLRYGVTFNRVNHTNTQEPPYTFYYTLPVNINWDYDDS